MIAAQPSTIRVMALHALAFLFQSQGRDEKAAPLYVEALERRKRALGADHPETMESMNGLAWFLLTARPPASRDPERALALALEVAERTEHRDPDYLDTLSLAYHLTGQTAKAVANQRKALALLPEGPSETRTAMEEALARYEALAGSE